MLDLLHRSNMRLIVLLSFISVTEAKKKTFESYEPVNRKKSLEANIPIPFGKIGIFGFGDPRFEEKQPIDFLDFVPPKSASRDPIRRRYKEMPDDVPPQDDIINVYVKKGTDVNDTVPEVGHDYVRTLEHNLEHPSRPHQLPRPTSRREEAMTREFEDGTFMIPSEPAILDRTTCDEFARKSYFHPKEIVNMDWVPFYVWYDKGVLYGLLHTFHYPKREDVRHFKDDIGVYVNTSIDWSAPKLLMGEYRNHLLIAADQRGLFIDVPDHSIPEYVKRNRPPVPTLVMRMKIVDKYLAVMYCDLDYAFIMAVPESVPYTDDLKIEEAAKLRLRGPGHPVSRSEQYEKEIEEERTAHIRLKEPKMMYIHEPLPPIP